MHICWYNVLFSLSIVSLNCSIEFCKLVTFIVNILYVGQSTDSYCECIICWAVCWLLLWMYCMLGSLLTLNVSLLYVGQSSSVLIKWQILRTQTHSTLLFHIYHHSFILWINYFTKITGLAHFACYSSDYLCTCLLSNSYADFTYYAQMHTMSTTWTYSITLTRGRTLYLPNKPWLQIFRLTNWILPLCPKSYVVSTCYWRASSSSLFINSIGRARAASNSSKFRTSITATNRSPWL
jgi:hypothetical protein